MKKYLAICLCVVTALSLTACGNKDYFTPTIAVEQVLDNIAKASGKAPISGAIDTDEFAEVGAEAVESLTVESGLSINTDAIVTPQAINSENSSVEGSHDTEETAFESTVVVPEEKNASLLSRLFEAITKPKSSKSTTTSTTTTTTTTSASNKNKKNKNNASTPAPSTPAVEEKAPVVTDSPVKNEEVAVPEQKEVAVPEQEEVAAPEQEVATPEEETVPTPEENPVDEEDKLPVEEATPEIILPITVLIINECGAEATVVSVINPKTDEQVNLGTLGIDEMFILKMEWPSKTKNFRIAVYGADGNIVMQKALEFTGITESAAVILSGSGSLEDFTFEAE